MRTVGEDSIGMNETELMRMNDYSHKFIRGNLLHMSYFPKIVKVNINIYIRKSHDADTIDFGFII